MFIFTNGFKVGENIELCHFKIGGVLALDTSGLSNMALFDSLDTLDLNTFLVMILL